MHRLLTKNDTEKLVAFLMGDEVANTFMLGNLLSFGVENDRRTLRRGEYWGYFEGGALLGVAAFFNNSQCMVYYTHDAVMPQMASDIAYGQARLVLGGDRCVRPMLPALKGSLYKISIREQFFMELAGGTPALARAEGFEFEDARAQADRRPVQDFVMRCMREGFGFGISRGTVKKMLKEKADREHYVLLKIGGGYVAQAHIQARTPHFCQIGGVCTLPGERRRGYARAVLTRIAGLIAEDGGRKACLVVNSDNAPARRLYEELGFRETGKLMLVDFL